MTPLNYLADDAASAVSDLLSDEQWDAFDALSDLEKVQWRYCHADCDDFAMTLSEITGYPVVAVSSLRRGPLHRLVEAPDGRLLDVMGWVSLEMLKSRYKQKSLEVFQAGCLYGATAESDDDLLPVLETVLQLPYAPFNSAEFQDLVRCFAYSRKLSLGVDSSAA